MEEEGGTKEEKVIKQEGDKKNKDKWRKKAEGKGRRKNGEEKE